MSDLDDKEIEALCDPGNCGGYQTSRLISMAREIRRHRSMVAKFEAWASRLDDIGGLTGCHAVAAGIRNTIKGLS